jgi:hypothetical protein
MRLLVSGCKERKRVHSRVMPVHPRLQESSFIDLFEVGMGVGRRLTRLLFFVWLIGSRSKFSG